MEPAAETGAAAQATPAPAAADAETAAAPVPPPESAVQPAPIQTKTANAAPAAIEAETAAERAESAERLEKLLRTPTLDPAQVGRRRDFQRRELIGQELKAQGRFSLLITASIVLLLGTMELWKVQNALVSPQDGTLSPSDVIVIVVGLAAVCGFSWLAGWYASRLTRRQIIARLSRMSYDELLRHCRA